jgi:D-amino-acid dehydrogenase
MSSQRLSGADSIPPEHVVVVGAGIVGLSCAWFLQELGVRVTVLDRHQEFSGASAGNAGFISPAHCVPLPEPNLLRYGVRALLDRRSPVSLPLRGDLRRAKFLFEMVGHCTSSSWRRSMAAYGPLNALAIGAYDTQRSGGVTADFTTADIVSGFKDPRAASGLLEEFAGVVGAGQSIDIELLTAEEMHRREPHLSPAVRFGVLLRDQRFVTPRAYGKALAKSVRERGGDIIDDSLVSEVSRHDDRVIARTSAREYAADAIVLANGAWVSELATAHGVKIPVHAGRGYSFTVPIDSPLLQPVHFPESRLAVTPDEDRVRVVGVMEFDKPDAPLRQSRINSIIRALKPLLTGVNWDERSDDWVGPRPLTTDGLPVIGMTATQDIYVASGHGMWGMTLGPATGQILAEAIVTGHTPAEMAPFNPLR